MNTFLRWSILAYLCAVVPVYAADRDPDARRLITIDVLIAELDAARQEPRDAEISAKALLDLEKEGKLSHSTRVHLVTVEEQKAMVQVGERVAIVTGRAARARAPRPDGRGDSPPGAPVSTTYTVENFGTMVAAAARVENTGAIIIDLKVEKSRIAEDKKNGDNKYQDDADSREFRHPRVINLQSESTIQVRAGEPVLASGFGSTLTSQYVVITADIEQAPKPADGSAAAAAGQEDAESNLRIFTLQNASATEMVNLLQTVFGPRLASATADARTNSVIINARQESAGAVEALLRRLDEERTVQPTPAAAPAAQRPGQ